MYVFWVILFKSLDIHFVILIVLTFPIMSERRSGGRSLEMMMTQLLTSSRRSTWGKIEMRNIKCSGLNYFQTWHGNFGRAMAEVQSGGGQAAEAPKLDDSNIGNKWEQLAAIRASWLNCDFLQDASENGLEGRAGPGEEESGEDGHHSGFKQDCTVRARYDLDLDTYGFVLINICICQVWHSPTLVPMTTTWTRRRRRCGADITMILLHMILMDHNSDLVHGGQDDKDDHPVQVRDTDFPMDDLGVYHWKLKLSVLSSETKKTQSMSLAIVFQWNLLSLSIIFYFLHRYLLTGFINMHNLNFYQFSNGFWKGQTREIYTELYLGRDGAVFYGVFWADFRYRSEKCKRCKSAWFLSYLFL